LNSIGANAGQAAERIVTRRANNEVAIAPSLETYSAQDPAVLAEVTRLVEASLEALRDRHDHRHESFLRESIEKFPEFAPARWHSGYVRLGGAWVHVDQVPYLGGDSDRLREYAERREAADARHFDRTTTADSNRVGLVGTEAVKRIPIPPQTPTGRPGAIVQERDVYAREKLRLINTSGYSRGYVLAQESLARWCADNGLTEEARVHWEQVLSHVPANRTAAEALGMVEVGGKFVRKEHVESARRQEAAIARSLEKWQAKILRLRREAMATDAPRRQAGLLALSAIDDPEAIFAVERVILRRDPPARRQEFLEAIELTGIAVIARFDTRPATDSLVRFAVWHGRESVRQAAAKALAPREMHAFVPALLARLTMPIQYEVAVIVDEQGETQVQAELSQEHERHIVGLRDTRSIHDGNHLRLLSAAASARAKEVREFNQKASDFNRRIASALLASVKMKPAGEFKDLTLATRFDAPDPKRWWEWWYDYNEQYVSSEKPYYGYDYGMQTYDDYRVRYSPPMSCFAKGTPVWTLSGARPIEQVKAGDRVLSQNPETGELAYKGVLAVTVRPPSTMLCIRSGKSAIATTLGHPFFVVGKGWRMAKELRDDDWISTQGNIAPVDAIESAEPVEAHNLVVADFGTYFVGKDRLLVHDNSPLKPVKLEMPGLLASSP
jgi:hypothetical protein